MKARIGLSRTRASYIGPGLQLAPHKNSVATLALALRESFELILEGESRFLRVALIQPDTHHQLRARGPMLFFYADALIDNWEIPARLPPELLQDPPLCPDILAQKLGLATKEPRSPLFQSCVRLLGNSPERFPKVESLAEAAGLSVSRFQAVFREELGLSFRRYRVWSRLRVTARHLAQGYNLTESAHRAGFSSSAHFSHTFKEMFGLAPSSLLRLGVEFRIS